MTRCLAILALLAIAMPASAQDWLAQEYTVADGGLGTPTTPWGGPKYAKGRTSVLLFVVEPVNNMDCRQPMELARAFDFEVQYVHIQDHQRIVDNDRARQLLDSRRWDAIVFWCRYDWDCVYAWLADDVKFRVLQQVGDGTGLVITDGAPKEVLRPDRKIETPLRTLVGGLALTGRFARDDEHWKTRYNNKKPTAETAFRKDFFETFRVGKGRAVAYKAKFTFGDHYSKLHFALPFTWDYRIDPDYGLAELGRAILWAAGKEPDVEFAAEPPVPWSVAWGQSQNEKATWTLAVAGPKRTLTLRCRLRDLTGRVVAEDTKECRDAEGEVPYTFALPALGAGRYYLDIFVDSPRGREAYAYSTVHVPAPAEVSLEGLPDAVEDGEPVKGSVALGGEVPPNAKVELRFVDNSDRVLAAETKPAAKRAAFSFPTTRACSLQMRIQADVVANGISAGSAEKSANLLRRGQDRFSVVLWGTADGVWAHYGRRMLHRTGVTHIMAWGGEDAGLGTVPFSMAWGFEGEVDGHKFAGFDAKIDPKSHVMLPCCWNDEPNADKYVGFATKVFQDGQKHPVLVYNMRDEGPVSGCCLHPACLKAYRGWLKEQYKDSLDGLNREWGSQYKTWDEVSVEKEDDVREEEARKLGHYARWSDRQHFASVNFSRGILARQPRLFRQYDPKLRTGFEGSGDFGMDFDEIIANTGFWCPYDGLPTEMLRSLRPPGYLYSYWIGYQLEAPVLIGHAWRMVFSGAPSLWWWMCKGRGVFHGWLAPNMAPYPENQKFLDEVVLPLRRGLGDLLMGLEQQHDGIALYYSVAAANAGELGESAEYNSVVGSHANFVRLIEDCGYQWVYVTKPRLLAGDLGGATAGLSSRAGTPGAGSTVGQADRGTGIKLLVLPFHQALGEDEIAVLRKFVEDGGTLLADLRPGVFSGRCRPVEHSGAEALFGIERTGKGKAVSTEGQIATPLDGKAIPIVIRNNRSDAQIAPKTAKAAGTLAGAPIFLVNPLGKGRAILLNFHVTQYNGEREMAKGKAARDFFRPLAAAIGLQPRLQLSAKGEEARPPKGGTPNEELLRTRTVTWTKGGVTIHGLLRDGGEAGPATARLPRPMHLFHLRSGPKGQTNTATLPELRAGYGELIAAYPYDPGQPVVAPSKPTAKPGETVEFRLTMAGVPAEEQGPFSYHVVLLDPSGREVEWLPWSVLGPGGRVALPIQFAYNDPPGTWTLRVREITTGRTAEGTVTLSRP